MKYLKLFKSYENIDSICEKYGIENYTINDDGTVDVDGNVFLAGQELYKLPLHFGKVTGNFNITLNYLKSLEGCPQSVDGDFDCSENQLTSLKGGPKSVGGYFYCSYNQLQSLEECPQSVGGGFYCNNNQLISLNGCPANVQFIECERNPIYFWWKRLYYMEYLEIFLDMNIHTDDPYEINQEKINVILEQ